MTTGTVNYQDLLLAFSPRPITTEGQYFETVAQMNALMDKGNLTKDEQDFLTLLGTLVLSYEEEQYPDESFELRGASLLRGLIDLHGLTAADLQPIFKTAADLDAVLEERLGIDSEQARMLETFFNIPKEKFANDE